VLAHSGSTVTGIVLVQQAKQAAVSAVFDPATVAPTLFGSADPREYLLIGGVTDLVSGTAVRPGADVSGVLVRAAHAEAISRGLRPAALYVRDAELATFTGAGLDRTEQVSQACAIRLAGDDAGYLASLTHNQRRTVLKDRRRIDGLALKSEVLPAGEAVSLAPLVANVKARHGVADHPRLVRLRLKEWAAEPVGERVAFVVSGSTGPLAVTFACRTRERLEVYETGLADDAEDRHEAYVESLVYAPVRYAIEHGTAEVHLGLDAVTPKTRRGAVASPVWAMG
jgi:predicted N-acyltransferase